MSHGGAPRGAPVRVRIPYASADRVGHVQRTLDTTVADRSCGDDAACIVPVPASRRTEPDGAVAEVSGGRGAAPASAYVAAPRIDCAQIRTGRGFGLARLPDPDDVFGRGTLRSVDHVELDLFPFGQCPEALALNGGEVDKAILAVVGSRNEAESLLVIKPLHGSLRTHVLIVS